MQDRARLERQVRPGELHVVLAARADGLVCIVYTRTPILWLQSLQSDFKISRAEIRAAYCAPKIVGHLRARFPIQHDPEALLPWFRTTMQEAIAALDEYNPLTGDVFTALELNAPVLVNGLRGRVCGFMRNGLVAIIVERSPYVANLLIAARDKLQLAIAAPPADGQGKG